MREEATLGGLEEPWLDAWLAATLEEEGVAGVWVGVEEELGRLVGGQYRARHRTSLLEVLGEGFVRRHLATEVLVPPSAPQREEVAGCHSRVQEEVLRMAARAAASRLAGGEGERLEEEVRGGVVRALANAQMKHRYQLLCNPVVIILQNFRSRKRIYAGLQKLT